MPGVVLLVAAIVVNYRQHRHHRPTICSTTRRLLPRPAAAVGLCVGFAYLLGHVLNGYPKEIP